MRQRNCPDLWPEWHYNPNHGPGIGTDAEANEAAKAIGVRAPASNDGPSADECKEAFIGCMKSCSPPHQDNDNYITCSNICHGKLCGWQVNTSCSLEVLTIANTRQAGQCSKYGWKCNVDAVDGQTPTNAAPAPRAEQSVGPAPPGAWECWQHLRPCFKECSNKHDAPCQKQCNIVGCVQYDVSVQASKGQSIALTSSFYRTARTLRLGVLHQTRLLNARATPNPLLPNLTSKAAMTRL